MSHFNIPELISKDNRDRENFQCLSAPSDYRNLIVTPIIRRGFQENIVSGYSFPGVTATYLSIRLLDMLLAKHQQNTLFYAAEHPLRLSAIFDAFLNNDYKELTRITHIFDIASNYKISVLSPMDYIQIFINQWRSQTLKSQGSTEIMCTIRMICIYLFADHKFYLYHPSLIAISILYLFDLVPAEFLIGSSYQNIDLHNMEVCCKDILTHAEKFLSVYKEYVNVVPIIECYTIELYTILRKEKQFVDAKFLKSPVIHEFSPYQLADCKSFEEALKYVVQDVQMGSCGEVGTIHKFEKYVSKTFYCVVDCLKEFSVGKHFEHPKILKPITYAKYQTEGESDDNLITKHCIIYSKANSSLTTYIRELNHRNKQISVSIFMRYVYHIVTAVAYLHEQHMIHGDIKPDNILLCNNGDLQLCDFDTSTIIRHDDNPALMIKRGTRSFWPPEYFLENSYRDPFSSDMWALGCVIFYMVTGTPLIKYDSKINIPNQILTVNLLSHKEFTDLPADTVEFLTQLLNPNCDERMNIKEAQQHKFFVRCRRVVARE